MDLNALLTEAQTLCASKNLTLINKPEGSPWYQLTDASGNLVGMKSRRGQDNTNPKALSSIVRYLKSL